MSKSCSEPRRFVEAIVAGLPPGRALDLACGTGRNAVWLAERGWQVTAVDRSAAAIESLRDVAPGIETHVADLEKHEFAIEPTAWDLIVMSYYLQRDLFAPALRGLAAGGLLIAMVHMFEPGHESSRFSVHPGELPELLSAGEILEYREVPGEAGKRAVAQIAVRRKQVS